jgi:hypothetical protein
MGAEIQIAYAVNVPRKVAEIQPFEPSGWEEMMLAGVLS